MRTDSEKRQGGFIVKSSNAKVKDILDGITSLEDVKKLLAKKRRTADETEALVRYLYETDHLAVEKQSPRWEALVRYSLLRLRQGIMEA
jgi:hypothetical protein